MEPRRPKWSPGGPNGAQEAQMELRRPNGAQDAQMEPRRLVGSFFETTKLHQFHTAKASKRTRESVEKMVFFAISLQFPVQKQGSYIDPKNGVADIKRRSPASANRLIFADIW